MYKRQGQIGVSGSNVTFNPGGGAQVIGTWTGGTGGASLVISFAATATPEAVRILAQNITYEFDSTVPAGTTNRTLAMRLFDGDGGASLPAISTVTIQPSAPASTLKLSDLAPSVTVTEAAAQLGFVPDEQVQLEAGAPELTTLTVSYLSGSNRQEDQLSIRHQGSGSGQVGFNAGTREVSYQGVLIGTVNAADNGANGDQLVIDLNASATAEAVEHVIENLRYQTTSDGPLASRTVQVQVTDAASTTSAQSMVINITPEIDGASALSGDEQVNTCLLYTSTSPYGLQTARTAAATASTSSSSVTSPSCRARPIRT